LGSSLDLELTECEFVVSFRLIVTHPLRSVAIFAPAKINLFLALTGKRGDGYHDLVSLVSPLRFGDEICIEDSGEVGEDSLFCHPETEGLDEDLDIGPNNLVLRAAREFRKHREIHSALRFILHKKIPVGSGLGGGSSDAASVLLGMNRLVENSLDFPTLGRIAASIGSDVPLFLRPQACVVSGRGEEVQGIPESAKARLSGRRVLVFKPGFSIRTAWAYGKIDALRSNRPQASTMGGDLLSQWLASKDPLEAVVANAFREVLDPKFPVFPILEGRLRNAFGLTCGLSGSGSACFVLLPDDFDACPVRTMIAEALGDGAFMVESELV
jgi:4-diphosphocytidyl-2-C-methyl-D-erythritol kinase